MGSSDEVCGEAGGVMNETCMKHALKMPDIGGCPYCEIERLKGLLATGAGCEEGYRQHYADLLDKCEYARISAEEKARQCEERMMRYGEQAKFAQSELDDVIHTRDAAFSAGRASAAKEMLEMLEAYQTSYDLIGYEVETVGAIAKKFSDAITNHFGSEI